MKADYERWEQAKKDFKIAIKKLLSALNPRKEDR